jgi:hypothetical protein
MSKRPSEQESQAKRPSTNFYSPLFHQSAPYFYNPDAFSEFSLKNELCEEVLNDPEIIVLKKPVFAVNIDSKSPKVNNYLQNFTSQGGEGSFFFDLRKDLEKSFEDLNRRTNQNDPQEAEIKSAFNDNLVAKLFNTAFAHLSAEIGDLIVQEDIDNGDSWESHFRRKIYDICCEQKEDTKIERLLLMVSYFCGATFLKCNQDKEGGDGYEIKSKNERANELAKIKLDADMKACTDRNIMALEKVIDLELSNERVREDIIQHCEKKIMPLLSNGIMGHVASFIKYITTGKAGSDNFAKNIASELTMVDLRDFLEIATIKSGNLVVEYYSQQIKPEIQNLVENVPFDETRHEVFYEKYEKILTSIDAKSKEIIEENFVSTFDSIYCAGNLDEIKDEVSNVPNLVKKYFSKPDTALTLTNEWKEKIDILLSINCFLLKNKKVPSWLREKAMKSFGIGADFKSKADEDAVNEEVVAKLREFAQELNREFKAFVYLLDDEGKNSDLFLSEFYKPLNAEEERILLDNEGSLDAGGFIRLNSSILAASPSFSKISMEFLKERSREQIFLFCQMNPEFSKFFAASNQDEFTIRSSDMKYMFREVDVKVFEHIPLKILERCIDKFLLQGTSLPFLDFKRLMIIKEGLKYNPEIVHMQNHEKKLKMNDLFVKLLFLTRAQEGVRELLSNIILRDELSLKFFKWLIKEFGDDEAVGAKIGGVMEFLKHSVEVGGNPHITLCEIFDIEVFLKIMQNLEREGDVNYVNLVDYIIEFSELSATFRRQTEVGAVEECSTNKFFHKMITQNFDVKKFFSLIKDVFTKPEGAANNEGHKMLESFVKKVMTDEHGDPVDFGYAELREYNELAYIFFTDLIIDVSMNLGNLNLMNISGIKGDKKIIQEMFKFYKNPQNQIHFTDTAKKSYICLEQFCELWKEDQSRDKNFTVFIGNYLELAQRTFNGDGCNKDDDKAYKICEDGIAKCNEFLKIIGEGGSVGKEFLREKIALFRGVAYPIEVARAEEIKNQQQSPSRG